jgi:hypothetical protein
MEQNFGKEAERPKLRWFDYIHNNLISMGVKRWRKKAGDRSVWAITPDTDYKL